MRQHIKFKQCQEWGFEPVTLVNCKKAEIMKYKKIMKTINIIILRNYFMT